MNLMKLVVTSSLMIVSGVAHAEQHYADLPFAKAVEERSKRLANNYCEKFGMLIGASIAKEAVSTQNWQHVSNQLNQQFNEMQIAIAKLDEPEDTKESFKLAMQYMPYLTDTMIQDEQLRLYHDPEKLVGRTVVNCMNDLPSILSPIAEKVERGHRDSVNAND